MHLELAGKKLPEPSTQLVATSAPRSDRVTTPRLFEGSSKPARASAAKQRWRRGAASVRVLNRVTSALKAIRRTIFDQLQKVIGARLRSDNDTSSRQRAWLSARRSSKYTCSSAPVVAE